MMIVNLTQHPTTSDQLAAGVQDLPAEVRDALVALLTFANCPDRQEIFERAEDIAELACYNGLGGDDGDSPFPAGAMIGGNASISYDVPPFAIAAERNQIHGLNVVGLRRSKMAHEHIVDLKRCYHAVYCGPGDLRARVQSLLAGRDCREDNAGRRFLEVFAGGKRGFARPRVRGYEAGEAAGAE